MRLKNTATCMTFDTPRYKGASVLFGQFYSILSCASAKPDLELQCPLFLKVGSYQRKSIALRPICSNTQVIRGYVIFKCPIYFFVRSVNYDIYTWDCIIKHVHCMSICLCSIIQVVLSRIWMKTIIYIDQMYLFFFPLFCPTKHWLGQIVTQNINPHRVG